MTPESLGDIYKEKLLTIGVQHYVPPDYVLNPLEMQTWVLTSEDDMADLGVPWEVL